MWRKIEGGTPGFNAGMARQPSRNVINIKCLPMTPVAKPGGVPPRMMVFAASPMGYERS
jgi:hypothetical protein